MDNRGKKPDRRRGVVQSKRRNGAGLLKFRKIAPVVFLSSLLMLTLIAVGYVIFFRTVIA